MPKLRNFAKHGHTGSHWDRTSLNCSIHYLDNFQHSSVCLIMLLILSASVTRCWIKIIQFCLNCPKSSPSSFYVSAMFQNWHSNIWVTFLWILYSMFFKNNPIWSHCCRLTIQRSFYRSLRLCQFHISKTQLRYNQQWNVEKNICQVKQNFCSKLIDTFADK